MKKNDLLTSCLFALVTMLISILISGLWNSGREEENKWLRNRLSNLEDRVDNTEKDKKELVAYVDARVEANSKSAAEVCSDYLKITGKGSDEPVVVSFYDSHGLRGGDTTWYVTCKKLNIITDQFPSIADLRYEIISIKAKLYDKCSSGCPVDK